ncbi:hypothetical protein MGH68_01220 [Erysipelothrix sp. D19-032]
MHRQYGIGRYMGITTKEIEGVHKDFMRIMYRDGDELFVPLEQFSLVRKYMSSKQLRLSSVSLEVVHGKRIKIELNKMLH